MALSFFGIFVCASTGGAIQLYLFCFAIVVVFDFEYKQQSYPCCFGRAKNSSNGQLFNFYIPQVVFVGVSNIFIFLNHDPNFKSI